MIIRSAQSADAPELAKLINEIIQIGGTTAHRTPFDADRMRNHYIAGPRTVSCMVAVSDQGVLGFQSLARPDPEWEGDEVIPADWGIIATFTKVGGTQRGIGRALFAQTLVAARAADIPVIDATIRHENKGGQAFYSKMGFVDYCDRGAAISKRYDVRAESGD